MTCNTFVQYVNRLRQNLDERTRCRRPGAGTQSQAAKSSSARKSRRSVGASGAASPIGSDPQGRRRRGLETRSPVALAEECPPIMERIQKAKGGFRSLTEAIDTTTPAGRMMMQMVGAFAEFEREAASRTHQSRAESRPQGGTRRRTQAEAEARTAEGNRPDGHERQKDRCRCRQAIQGASVNRFSVTPAGISTRLTVFSVPLLPKPQAHESDSRNPAHPDRRRCLGAARGPAHATNCSRNPV